MATLSRRERVIVGAGTVVALVVGGYLFLVEPLLMRARAAEDEWDESLLKEPKLLNRALLRHLDFNTPVIAAMRGGKGPGPESSIVKVVTTEINLAINRFATELLGAYSQIELDAPFAIAEGRWLYRMLASRGLTIAAGSSEIQRNIIGERVLGLPKG